ncbi:MAG: SOS response-associated peptidase [Caldilineaceae bacterium]
MCGRFTLRASSEQVADLFSLEQMPPLAPRYNIAPTQPVLAIRESYAGNGREATFLNWGLIPFWAKDPSIGSRMINARAETAAEKPSFRAAFKYRRCIIPADGFYEWQKVDGGKQPQLIGLKGGGVLGFAGLWEHWEQEGSAIESCTILTTEPNDLLAPIHNRMPMILHPEDYDEWLSRDIQKADPLLHLMRSFPGELMAYQPVSTLVNNPRNEDPACAVPLV